MYCYRINQVFPLFEVKHIALNIAIFSMNAYVSWNMEIYAWLSESVHAHYNFYYCACVIVNVLSSCYSKFLRVTSVKFENEKAALSWNAKYGGREKSKIYFNCKLISAVALCLEDNKNL